MICKQPSVSVLRQFRRPSKTQKNSKNGITVTLVIRIPYRQVIAYALRAYRTKLTDILLLYFTKMQNNLQNCKEYYIFAPK